MIANGVGPGAAPAPTVVEQHAALRKVAHQLEGVFLAQLFQAMRQTVPQESGFDGGSGESMFQSMQDDLVASKAAERSMNGLGESLYRQLSRHLAPLDQTTAGAIAPPVRS
jgi:Rod binding domain-containing protein